MKKIIGAITVVMGILLLILLDCSKSKDLPKVAMYRANLQRTGVYNARGMHELGGLKWKSKTEDEVVSDPIIFDEVVYFGGSDGYLHAVDSNTGQEKWRFKAKGSVQEVSDPAIADAVMYFGSDDGYLHAIDMNTGQENWKFKTQTWSVSTPSIADGVVYFGTWDGHIYAVDIKTGQEKWKFRIEGRVISSPSIADGFVYFKSKDGILYALEGRTTVGYDIDRSKEEENAIVNTSEELEDTKSMSYPYQGSLFLNNLYGERTVDIYVTVFEKDYKISQIILKVYNYQGIINFLAYAPQIDFPRYPDRPYPQSGLITCLPLELGSDLPTALKKPLLYPNTWREYVFHYGPDRCTERPQEFPSISDILSGSSLTV